MSKIEKPLAKSLHTVTVILQVARTDKSGKPAERVSYALAVLGLKGKPDPYGLAAQATRLLTKEAK